MVRALLFSRCPRLSALAFVLLLVPLGPAPLTFVPLLALALGQVLTGQVLLWLTRQAAPKSSSPALFFLPWNIMDRLFVSFFVASPNFKVSLV